VLKPDDRGAPFVAKIDSIEQLKDEMGRFSRFISPWETQLQPELHIHGSIGVILFGLVGDAGRGGTPAPTLEDRLRLLSAVERGATISNAPSLTDLTTAVNRTVQKLTELNSLPCNPRGVTNSCWLGIEPLRKMKDRNINYTVNGSGGTIDIIQLCERAISKAARLNGKGTVHGDVHCRNVLLRDDREPFLIDYANSGPGHPCFDLIRFESALVFSNLRMTTDEAELEACFKHVFVDGKSFDEISRIFPSICASAGSHIALEAAVRARAAALEMATKYGGDEEDYLAVKFIIACQSLTIPEFQSGVVRAAIKALAPLIAKL